MLKEQTAEATHVTDSGGVSGPRGKCATDLQKTGNIIAALHIALACVCSHHMHLPTE